MQGIEKLSNYIVKIAGQEEDKTELIEYGLKVIWLNLSKTLLLLAVCAVLGIINYGIFMFVVYAALRASAFGVHFKNNIVCASVGVSVYLICIYTAMNVMINDLFCIGIFLICGFIYALYAPAQTKKRPIGPNQYKRFKVIAMITVVILFVVAIKLGDGVYRNLVILPVILEAVCILPLTYKVIEKF